MPDKRLKTGRITPEMIQQVMECLRKGEIHCPQQTVSPLEAEMIKKMFNRE